MTRGHRNEDRTNRDLYSAFNCLDSNRSGHGCVSLCSGCTQEGRKLSRRPSEGIARGIRHKTAGYLLLISREDHSPRRPDKHRKVA